MEEESLIMVDSCVWIEHFEKKIPELQQLMEKKNVAVCGIILLEFIPFLRDDKELDWIQYFFRQLKRIDKNLEDSDWENLIFDQQKLIHHGINRIGIPDLLIMYITKLQNARLYTIDKTMKKAAHILHVPLYEHS